MPRILLRAAAAIVVIVAAAGPSLASQSDDDKRLLAAVSANLLAQCPRPAGFEWPPDIGIEPDPGVNAYATFVRKNGKRQPVIRVSEGMMRKVIKGDPDKLAFVLGHELGHVVLGHLTANDARDRTPFLKMTFGRDEEVDADLYGFELMLRAGYSFQKGVKAITDMQELGLEYSSFEGLGKGHPSWNDRLAKANKDRAELWKAMAAFHNGVLFLAVEDYRMAEVCFEMVTRSFPGCYQAWANLGYARLMRYCDQWGKEDIREFAESQLVLGGFYTRLKADDLRAKDSKLWFNAVGALREANRLKGGQTVVLSNLALAYLVHPDGKDVGEAAIYFADAVAAVKKDKDLDPVVHATLLINLGVNTLAAGETEKGLAQLDEGEKIVRSFAGPAAKRLTPSFDSALLYTRAMVLARKDTPADRQKAVAMLDQYLRTTSTRSLWWDVAYDKYTELCKTLGQEPKDAAAFKDDRPAPIRLVTGVTLKGVDVRLGGEIAPVVKQLGPGRTSIAVPDTNLVRIRYDDDGIEILANSDKVLAIVLVGPTAPPLPLNGKTLGAGKVGELKIGMTLAQVEELLGKDYQVCEIVEAEVYYRSYREQGVAVRIVKGKVVEIVVVQLPNP